MEEQKTNHNTLTHPTSSAPSRDPPPPATAHGGDSREEEEEEEDPGKTREPKKRKGCPSVLEKCESLIIKKKNSPLNSSCSFTFDTKICGVSGFASTPESTPKFGSFNLVANSVIRRKEKDEEEEEAGEDLDEVKLKQIVD